MIGTRTLIATTSGGERDVLITISNPVEDNHEWVCAYTIAWPDRNKRIEAKGIDALQANYLALLMVGAELYTSSYHAAGKLRWEKQGEGYGFPVPAPLRHLLIGEDRKFDA